MHLLSSVYIVYFKAVCLLFMICRYRACPEGGKQSSSAPRTLSFVGRRAQVAAVAGGGRAPPASLYARTEPATYLSN